eukprot:328103-Pelagomonas_calceolata.AAC.1
MRLEQLGLGVNTPTVNLSQFVVDLRSRHLGYCNQLTAPDPRRNNIKQLTYHQWCALPVRNAYAIDPPYTMPKYVCSFWLKHMLSMLA